MNTLFKRLSEPSSYAGLAGVLLSLNQLFNLHGVPEVAGAVAQAGKVVAQGGSPVMAGCTFLAGLAAFFLPEKKTP